jgi:hypothetical protein
MRDWSQTPPLIRLYLLFLGPFDRQVPTNLTVHNPNSKPVAYKVKVTAPKSYVVKPNSGRIEPGETVKVQGEYSLYCALQPQF